ncbi:MAG: methyltransferase domain-containing protein [Limnohabitans sp.]
MNDGFYRAFEQSYNPAREVIKEWRRQYLPFIAPLKNIYPGSSTFDAGCGRGEWLELMIEQGFTPVGVDLDEGMLSACIELKLPAQKADAMACLSSLTTGSQAVVAAFHVVEHVSIEPLRKFVNEALRVLRPGGLLIMETLNLKNIAVSTRNFYLDPTHQRPIPMQLHAFVAEFENFEGVKILRLNEPHETDRRENIGLTELGDDDCPVYAVVAQKKADAALLAQSQELFDGEYGVSLHALPVKLGPRLARNQAQLEQEIKLSQQAEIDSRQLLTAHHADDASKSWRLMAPLPWVFRQIKRLHREGLKARVKAVVKKALRKINHELLVRPRLRQHLVVRSRGFGWYAFLKRVHADAHGQHVSSNSLGARQSPVAMNYENLPPRAQQFYNELKQAIEQQKRGSN